MSEVFVNEQYLLNIANSIRSKNQTNNTYKPREMSQAIENLLVADQHKWKRPIDWPNYSKIDISDEEVIYLTYDCTLGQKYYISILIEGDYIVQRGSLNNGIFTIQSSSNHTSGEIFQQLLPNENRFVVYRILPQQNSSITQFQFARRYTNTSAGYFSALNQPCIERYCSVPNWLGVRKSGGTLTYSTYFLVADTIYNAAPDNIGAMYSDGNSVLQKCDFSKSSFKNVTSLVDTFNGCNVLHDVSFPHDLSNKCTTPRQMFQNCWNLRKLDLSGWDTSGFQASNSMFYCCYNLIEIKGIEDFDLSSATALQNFFTSCRSISKLDLSQWKTSNVLTTIYAMFNDCQSLKQIDVSKINTENVSDFSNIFNGCRNLEKIDLTSWDFSKCNKLASIFSGCRNLMSLLRVKNWDTSKVQDFSSMFRECKRLEEIDISEFDFSAATTVRYMFYYCTNLKKLNATFNFSSIVTRINVADFLSYCYAFKDVSSLNFINSSFMPSLAYDHNIQEEIVFPNTITQMGDSCLRDLSQCDAFNFLNFENVPTLGAATDIINGMNQCLKIFVPNNLYETWKSTTPWNNSNLVDKILNADDYNLYKNIGSNILTLDLSNCQWVTNNSYQSNPAIGTPYATVVPTGTGKRICSGLIDLPTGTNSFIVSIEGQYPYTLLMFDSDGLFLKRAPVEWGYGSFLIHNSNIKKIAIVLRKKDGSIALLPTNWAESGISIKYILNN